MLYENAPQQRDLTRSSPMDSSRRTQLYAFVIAAVLCSSFCVVFLVFAFEPAGKDLCIRLEDRINPNTAPVSSLVRLPSIGLSRAWSIVNYRENVRQQCPGIKVFKSCDDLQKIKGIGPKTAEGICNWLTFEGD